jgi:hypothetical protein
MLLPDPPPQRVAIAPDLDSGEASRGSDLKCPQDREFLRVASIGPPVPFRDRLDDRGTAGARVTFSDDDRDSHNAATEIL